MRPYPPPLLKIEPSGSNVVLKWPRPMLRSGETPSFQPEAGSLTANPRSRVSEVPTAGGAVPVPVPGAGAPLSAPPRSTTLVEPFVSEGASHPVPHDRSCERRACPVSGCWEITSVQTQVVVSMTAESYLVGPASSTLWPPAPRVVVLGSTNMCG